ncbi:MAG: Ig domain-containing protein [Syntrophomonadaceae bacterium]|nr:Ig domain-containing protein [Syntrophomonadaceae bacterium]
MTIELSPEELPDALFGADYPTATLTAMGGTEPYTFAVTDGLLPTGLTLGPESGNISGTFEEGEGDYTFTVTATDSNGDTGTGEYTIHTYPMITLTDNLIDLETDPAATLTADGGAGGDYTFALSSDDAYTLSTYGLTLNEVKGRRQAFYLSFQVIPAPSSEHNFHGAYA